MLHLQLYLESIPTIASNHFPLLLKPCAPAPSLTIGISLHPSHGKNRGKQNAQKKNQTDTLPHNPHYVLREIRLLWMRHILEIFKRVNRDNAGWKRGRAKASRICERKSSGWVKTLIVIEPMLVGGTGSTRLGFFAMLHVRVECRLRG